MDADAKVRLRNQFSTINKRISKISQMDFRLKAKRTQVLNALAINEYGKIGDLITFKECNDEIKSGKIIGFADSFFNDIPICLISVTGSLVTYETHLSDSSRIIK